MKKLVCIFAILHIAMFAPICAQNNDMVLVEGGTFQMGSDNEEDNPVHRVTLTRDFYMCDHAVTQAEWQAVMGNNPSHFASDVAAGETQENRPVEQVGWYDAIVYCNRRSMAEGLSPCYTINGVTNPTYWGPAPISYNEAAARGWDDVDCDFDADGYRLPTEAEWEYAARGGESHAYAGSGMAYEVAWYDANSNGKTHEVKKKKPNAWGLYDMSGNVWEWCWDRYNSGATAEAATDPAGATTGSFRVFRGGSWWNEENLVTVSYRFPLLPYFHFYHIVGFRVVRTAL